MDRELHAYYHMGELPPEKPQKTMSYELAYRHWAESGKRCSLMISLKTLEFLGFEIIYRLI